LENSTNVNDCVHKKRPRRILNLREGLYLFREITPIRERYRAKMGRLAIHLAQIGAFLVAAKDKEEKQKVIDLWLARHTQDEISGMLGISQQKTSKITTNGKNANNGKIAQNPPESLKIFNL